MFNFEHLDFFFAWIGHLSQNLSLFEFLESFCSSILSVSIYYWPASDILVKSYGRSNFPCTLMFNFERLHILCGWIRHLSEKLWSYEFAESFHFLILWVSIYYWPESDIEVKSCGCLNLSCASMFNFEHHDIFFAWIEHPSQKLWQFEFLESFRCSISGITIYYWPELDIQVKGCDRLNLPCALMYNPEHHYILCP